jgi:hypothetical protein
MKARRESALEAWAGRINLKANGPKAVCKPCWELKYCPYGPLVEDFPLREEPDPERSCRIFAHDCPVFTVAEGFTETRELRNVTRHIPRPMQFRVLKRDNQICALCERPVLDGKIHFDHIIPWSKGGPTEEHNIRLLCDACNRKRGAKFEDQYLIRGIVDHMSPPIDRNTVRMLLHFVSDVHRWRLRSKRLPTGRDVARLTGLRRTAFEDRMAEMFNDLHQFFNADAPRELRDKLFLALKDRWGFGSRGSTLRLSKIADAHKLGVDTIALADMDLVRRLGFNVPGTTTARNDWARS